MLLGGISQALISSMIVMQLNIDVYLQMTVASNCSNFTSFDLRVKPKTVAKTAEVDESNENREFASKMTSFEALLAFW